jgi:hypothetical protein
LKADTAPENAGPSSHRVSCPFPTLLDWVLPRINDCDERQALHLPSVQLVSCNITYRYCTMDCRFCININIPARSGYKYIVETTDHVVSHWTCVGLHFSSRNASISGCSQLWSQGHMSPSLSMLQTEQATCHPHKPNQNIGGLPQHQLSDTQSKWGGPHPL